MDTPSQLMPQVEPSDRFGFRVVADRYLLMQSVGPGGMSDVWLAWDRTLKCHCVLKELRSALAEQAIPRQRFELEALVMRKLRHPHVVTVYDLISHRGAPVLILELMQRGSLADWVRREGGLPPRMAVGIVQKVLNALQLAHEHNVVHRDVKPANILLDSYGTPKLADFGIAHLMDRSGPTWSGQHPGTLDYMAPEQERGLAIDRRTDVYAVSATLYNLLTGLSPNRLYLDGFDSERWRGVPEPLIPVLVQGTRREPEARLQSAIAMRLALDEVLHELAPPPPRYSLPPEITLPEPGFPPDDDPVRKPEPRMVLPKPDPDSARVGLAGALRWLPVVVGLLALVWVLLPEAEPPVVVVIPPEPAGPTSVKIQEDKAPDPTPITPAPEKTQGKGGASAGKRPPREEQPSEPAEPTVSVALKATEAATVVVDGADEWSTDTVGLGSKLSLAPGPHRLSFVPASASPGDVEVNIPHDAVSMVLHCDLAAAPITCTKKQIERVQR